MTLRKSSSFFCKQDLIENKGKQNGSEEDLYFEMEYPQGNRSRSGTQESDTISFSSKSVESFGSECTVDSQDSPFRDGRRGSSVGPILERPTSLKFTSKFKKDTCYGSLPRTTQPKIPKFSFQNFSVPTTPADFWEKSFMRKGDITSSTSSVEEATESMLKKTRSRLSLNLGILDGSSSPGSPTRSPRFIPKFLSSSFSKLKLKDRAKTPESSQEPMSLPFLGNLFSSTQNSPRLEEPQCDFKSNNFADKDDISPPSTPTTKLFVEESIAQGLPIIPFNYPTFVIVEKMRSNGKPSPPSNRPINEEQEILNKQKHVSYSEPSSRKISCLLQPETSDFCLEEKSLKKLLGRAKKEMEEEASLKKVSSIRGYAANNSRALQRRRSSVSEYVGMSVGTSNDSPKHNYSILESSTRRDSLKYYLSGRGKGKIKSRKSNVIKCPAMQIGGNNEDYLDMSCGRTQS